MFKDLYMLRIMRVDMPRMKHAAAAVMMILYTAATILSGACGTLPARLVFVSFATSLLSALFFMYRRMVIAIFPVIAAVAVFVLTRSVTLTLSSLLLPLPAALLISSSLTLGADKARAVTAASVSFALSSVLLIAVYRITGGRLPTYESIPRSLTEFFSSMTAPSANGPVPAFSAEAASAIARYITLSSPAIVFVTVSAVSYVAVTLCTAMIDLFFFGEWIPPGARVYTPSVISAALYLLAYLVSASLVSTASADVIGYAAENVLLCLLPAMMIHGERSLYRLAANHDRRMLFIILSAFLLMLSPSIYLMFVSFSGAIALIYTTLSPIVKHLLGHDGDDDDDDGDYYD